MTGVTVRAALSAVKYQRQHHVNLCGNIFSIAPKAAFTVSTRPCLGVSLFPPTRSFSSQEVTKNLRLMTPEDVKPKVDKKSLAVEIRNDRPLVVFLEWMAAHKNHVKKFTDLYLGSGYDVLVAPLTPSQLLFPRSGSQLIADDLIRFLAENPAYKRVIVHGFSVGGYLWGEICLKMDKHPALPQQIVGQVWDSLVDVVGVSQGVAASIFPKNDTLKKMVNSCIQLHLWMFRNVATKHYEASSAMFHDPPVKAPALVLASRNDPICSFKEMMEVVDGWREQNVKITMKIWDDSPHVGHMRKYRKEYIEELNSFLHGLNLPVVHDKDADKITSKL
ncbi:transmembrane protein 53-A isoform X2 [Thrips palmi]|uniref:Transmembrane protein 53-A isoform X2 n=1 Tax=Thrips palmi TaxID=161013 RepID=A0A6P8YWP3_THRPL|nr:transmembrane protein 53-A isoform X2 [Thrips palmi]